jgi:hypothetical protein
MNTGNLKLIYSIRHPGRLTPKGKAELRTALDQAARLRASYGSHGQFTRIRNPLGTSPLGERDTGVRLLSCATRTLPIPLSSELSHEAQQWGQAERPRKQNWESPTPAVTRSAERSIGEHGFQYKGRFKGWTGSRAYVCVQSYGAVDLEGTLHTRIEGVSRRVRPGRGYHWAVVTDAIALVHNRTGEHYHPDNLDIEEGQRHIAAMLRAKVGKQQEIGRSKAQLAARLKRYAQVWVCLQDSVTAGNCRWGTEQYARRHQLDVSKHYRAAELPEQLTDRQVAAAILQAAKRQQEDSRRGYCEVQS